jgi:Ca2+-binding EF-hand superfamily protein
MFAFLDANRDGSVDFEAFLIGVRGKPNAKRQGMIDKAFLRFDKTYSGKIDIKDLK